LASRVSRICIVFDPGDAHRSSTYHMARVRVRVTVTVRVRLRVRLRAHRSSTWSPLCTSSSRGGTMLTWRVRVGVRVRVRVSRSGTMLTASC